jgi:hypothetical protein
MAARRSLIPQIPPMSLKSFHVFFIAMAVLSSLGFCLWAFTLGGAAPASATGMMGIGSGLLGVALAVYGIWFVVRKARHLIV